MNNGCVDDKFEGVCYSTKYSEKAHAITVSIKSKAAFDLIVSALKDLYNFSKNKNGNGIEAHFTCSGKNVALTLYNNKTLFIQGGGCRLWKNSEFNSITNRLDLLDPDQEVNMIDLNSDTRSRSSSNNSVDTPVTTSPHVDSGRSNKSPLAYLSSMISTLRQSRSRASQNSGNRHPISTHSTPRIGISRNSTSLSNDTEQTFVKEPFSLSHRSTPNDCSHQTSVKEPFFDDDNDLNGTDSTLAKQLFRDDNINDIDSTLNDGLTSPGQTMVNGIAGEIETEDMEAAAVPSNGAKSIDNTSSSSKQTEPDSRLPENLDENKLLQVTLKELLAQSKLLKAENEKLLALNECKQNEIKTLQSKVRLNEGKVGDLEMELSRMKSDLADANAKNLIYEEENKNAQRLVDDISKEKSKLLDDKMSLRGCTDALELKIENSAEYIENSVVDKIKEMKDMIMKEIGDLRIQIDKSKEHTNEKTDKVKLSNEHKPNINKPHNNVTSGKPIPVIVNHSSSSSQCEERPISKKKRAFVAGDSITRILSPTKMCDSNLEVKVKSHSGGRVRNVENSLKRLSVTDPDFVKSLDVVVLHVGTNNVSDAESGKQIVKDFNDTINSLNALNPSAKVIVSSILPRRNDKLVNEKINQTNRALQKECDQNGHYYLDNTTNVGTPSHYRDNIHLNPRGGKVLGNNMTSAIRAVLGLKPAAISTDVDKTSFRNGRSPGWRDVYQSRQQMYVMPMPPYWLGGQSQWPLQNHAWF